MGVVVKKLLLGGAALVAFAAGPAIAADMPVKAPVYKAPVAAPAYSWTGFYAGVSLGARWVDADWTTLFIDGPAHLPSPFSARQRFDSSGFRTGGYLGHNWQIAPTWIVGIEGDVAWAHNNKTNGGIPGTYA